MQKPSRYFKIKGDGIGMYKTIYYKYHEEKWYMWLPANAMWFISPLGKPISKQLTDCSKEEINEVTRKIF